MGKSLTSLLTSIEYCQKDKETEYSRCYRKSTNRCKPITNVNIPLFLHTFLMIGFFTSVFIIWSWKIKKYVFNIFQEPLSCTIFTFQKSERVLKSWVTDEWPFWSLWSLQDASWYIPHGRMMISSLTVHKNLPFHHFFDWSLSRHFLVSFSSVSCIILVCYRARRAAVFSEVEWLPFCHPIVVPASSWWRGLCRRDAGLWWMLLQRPQSGSLSLQPLLQETTEGKPVPAPHCDITRHSAEGYGELAEVVWTLLNIKITHFIILMRITINNYW